MFEIKESHDNSPISIKESSESLDDCNRLISDSEHNYEDSAADREYNGPSCFNPCITAAEINALSIVCGTVFISADANLSLIVQRDREVVDYYKLDYENNETIDFIVHLLMNKNVLKIVNDLEKLKKLIDLKSINSTFDISLASTESNFIDFYNNTVKNYSIKQFESFKVQNTLKILKTFNTSDDPNVIFRVDGHHKFFDEILINAYKSKLFEKFMVKVCKSESNTLELQIDHSLKSLIVDYFLTIIRSELKKSKLFSEIEVIIR